MTSYTDYLYARPSFIGGMAHCLDLGATLIEYNRFQSPEEADLCSIRSDWKAVASDLRTAIENCQKKTR